MLLLVALIGALAVIAGAWVANHGQVRRDRHAMVRETRAQAREAITAVYDFTGTVNSVVQKDLILGRDGYPEADLRADTAKLTAQYAEARHKLIMLTGAPDCCVMKQAEKLYAEVLRFSEAVMPSFKTSNMAEAEAAIKGATPCVEREVNVLLVQIEARSRLESTVGFGQYLFRSLEQANNEFDRR